MIASPLSCLFGSEHKYKLSSFISCLFSSKPILVENKFKVNIAH
ncbi:Putative uncharacterized protein [Moritella viscosa]|uniref:Uncharacterized protein n=1 Tax=Moritella viscosa TaxID=80854 RepID=A0ABY1HIM4_9GAMM|nr:Putative uncharacterized protein [Moritella viscosa]SHO28200.1 Putative uncharacterized protein [Moritella viscosa]